MAVLPGWRRLSGASRRYQGPEGQIISRRQYDVLVSAAGAHKPMSPVRLATQTRAQRVYARLANAFQRLKRALGFKGTKREVRSSAELKSIIRDMKRANKRTLAQRRSGLTGRTPAQVALLIDALKRAGLRDNIPDWVPPGLSDAYKR